MPLLGFNIKFCTNLIKWILGSVLPPRPPILGKCLCEISVIPLNVGRTCWSHWFLEFSWGKHFKIIDSLLKIYICSVFSGSSFVCFVSYDVFLGTWFISVTFKMEMSPFSFQTFWICFWFKIKPIQWIFN